MSVVAVRVYKDKIHIASDTQISTNNYLKENKSDSKLRKIKDNFYIGCTGYISEGNLFFHYAETKIPERNDTFGILEYLLDFQKWYRDKIDTDYLLENQNLIIFNNKVYKTISYNFVEEVFDYTAIGSGMESALAGLYLGYSPKEAVNIACNTNLYCSLPITDYIIKKTKGK